MLHPAKHWFLLYFVQELFFPNFPLFQHVFSKADIPLPLLSALFMLILLAGPAVTAQSFNVAHWLMSPIRANSAIFASVCSRWCRSSLPPAYSSEGFACGVIPVLCQSSPLWLTVARDRWHWRDRYDKKQILLQVYHSEPYLFCQNFVKTLEMSSSSVKELTFEWFCTQH